MILVDSSVWIDHFRSKDETLTGLLSDRSVLSHAFVIGELAMGSMAKRSLILAALRDLPQAVSAGDDEVLRFVERHGLFGLGIGYIDAHLLASVRLTPGASLWTRDKRLHDVAERLESAA